jgi:hypothetical protein
MMAKIHEEAEFETAGVQITQNLSTVRVHKTLHGFDLENDSSEADKVRNEFLHQPLPFVFKWQLRVRNNRESSQCQLDLQTLLVNCLLEATPLLFVNLKASTHDCVTLLFINDV